MAFAILVVLGAWVLWKKETPGLHRYDLLLAWGLKIAAAFVFVWVYIHYYGSGTLTADPDVFIKESAILAAVADHSIADYLRFMVGMETPEMIRHYLSETSHWTAGDLTLINDSKNVIRVNSLIHFISGNNSVIHAIVLSFFSLLGFRELYLAFYKQVRMPDRRLWFLLVAFPSLLFWTGSMLKEPLMIVGLCLVIRGLFDELPVGKRSIKLISGILLMLAFKPYVLICLLPAIAVYLTSKFVFRGKILISLAVLLSLVVVSLTAFPGKRDDTTYYLTRKQYDFVNIGRGGLHAYADTCFFYFRPDQFRYLDIRADSTVYLKRPIVAKQLTLGKASPFKDVYLVPNKVRWFNYYETNGCKSAIPVTSINASFTQLVLNIPEAFVNAAFRPFFGDPGGLLKFPAVVETILLFAFFALQLRHWKNVSQEAKLQVVTLVSFAFLLFILIGWTTPVLGAIVRYRIPAYLAVLIAALILYNQQKKLNHE